MVKLLIAMFFVTTQAYALDLDWSGQFRSEAHWLFNYAIEPGNYGTDSTKLAANGYYVPGGGKKNAYFQTLFLKLRPNIIVNDNIFIKSELHLGDPVYGFFGSGAPNTYDQKQYYSTESGGSMIKAHRVWAEFLSDLGTFQVGRAPLHWGLGMVWNDGNKIWDRYGSTGDVIRVTSKFGSFTFVPAVVKYSIGNNIGGACQDPTASATGKCTVTSHGAASHVTDYSLQFKYDNPDEDVEMGLNFIKRIIGGAQDPTSGYRGIEGTAAGSNYNTWDIYGRKDLGKIYVAGELPVTSGDVGGVTYRTYALALESGWRINEAWSLNLKTGHAPGQPNINGARPSVYRAFYFHPNYKLGLIMFNYQFRSFAGPNTLNNPSTSPNDQKSPFDNPIVNANYLMAGGAFRTQKWRFHSDVIYAVANETARAGSTFFNTWQRTFVANNSGQNQESGLGFEWDLGTTFFWDDAFEFNWDFGWYKPGKFYQFSNTPGGIDTASVFAVLFRAGVHF